MFFSDVFETQVWKFHQKVTYDAITLFSAAIPMTETISLIGEGVDHDKAPKDICKQISKPDHHTAINLYEHI